MILEETGPSGSGSPDTDPAQGPGGGLETIFTAAKTCFSQGDTRSALVCFEAATTAFDEEQTFWYALCLAQQSLGMTDAARSSAARLAELKAYSIYPQSPYDRYFERIQGPIRMVVEQLVRNALVARSEQARR